MSEARTIAVAAMLAREGRRVIGLTMQLRNQRRLPTLAGALAAAAVEEAVARLHGVPARWSANV